MKGIRGKIQGASGGVTNTKVNLVNNKHKYRPQESSGHRPKSTTSTQKMTAGDCIIRIRVNVQLQTKDATIVVCWDILLLCVKTKERSDKLKPNPHTVIIVMNR